MFRGNKSFFKSMVWSVLLVTVALWTNQAFAHYVWIESPVRVSLGEKETVKLFFGEYHEFLLEEAGGRLDERDKLTSWLIAPDGSKTAMKLEKKVNFFSADLKLEKPGRYNLIASDLLTEVKDGTKYASVGIMYKPMYYARTQFLAFESGRVSEREVEITEKMDLDIIPVTRHLDPVKGTISPKVGEEMVFKIFFKGEPLKKAKPSAYAPNGWVKELRTNSEGVFRFTPLWPGVHVIEFIQMEKEPGEFNGKAYEGTRHRVTFSVEVMGEVDKEGNTSA